MAVIAPCVTADSPETYKASVERIQPFAQRVHIDVSDGEFTPNTLMSASELWWPAEWQAAMVMHPEQHVQALVALKPHMIIFHAETKVNMVQVINYVKQFGIKAGVALLKTTVPASIKDILEVADHAMVFSGNLGQYGGTASLMQLEKVRLIKAINANIEIGWDGGVSLENAFALAQNGVDVLNVGKAIQQAADPASAYATLVNEINKHGVL